MAKGIKRYRTLRKDKRFQPGSVFLMPLADGRYGVCRVARLSTKAEEKHPGAPCMVVVASPAIFAAPPSIDDPRIRETLTMTYGGYQEQKGRKKQGSIWSLGLGPSVAAINISFVLPDEFKQIGRIEPGPQDRKLKCSGWGLWESLAKHVYRQWQWDHDRPAYEEAVAASDRQMQKSREKSRTTPGKVVSLSELRRRHLFKDWENYVSAGILRRCRRLFRETVDELVVLGPRPKRSVVLEILRRCTEQLNELDEAHDGFIETQEREDLCRLIDELGAAVGVRDKMPLADQWREW